MPPIVFLSISSMMDDMDWGLIFYNRYMCKHKQTVFVFLDITFDDKF